MFWLILCITYLVLPKPSRFVITGFLKSPESAFVHGDWIC